MRYFFEVSYDGTNYSGFQIQRNANTIQAEVEKALHTILRQPISLTGSSRTDAGVHAIQNFFHGDVQQEIKPESIYNINAVLPSAIVLKNIIRVQDTAHCRFDAITREYRYFIYQTKDPFLINSAWYYPYPLDLYKLRQAALLVSSHTNFENFAKSNTQVQTFFCRIIQSEWEQKSNCLVYKVVSNRFLRGMVRALVATMLKVGTGKITINQFEKAFTNASSIVDFSTPAHGLFLQRVAFPSEILSR